MAHEQIALLDEGFKANWAEKQFQDNHEDRCPVVMIYDCSGSMFMGEHPMIDELKRGHELLQDELVKDFVASARADISYIMYGADVAPPTMFATPAEVAEPGSSAELESVGVNPKFNQLNFEPMGATSTNAAILAAIDAIEERLKHYNKDGVSHYAPMIFLITDGWATDNDDPHPTEPGKTIQDYVVERLGEKISKHRWMFMPVYIPSGDKEWDMKTFETLNAYPSSPSKIPVPLAPGKMLKFFEWLSASVQTRSASRTDETVSFPASTGADSDFNWVMTGS